MRVVCDTTTLIGLVLAKGETMQALRRAWRQRAFTVLLSEPLLVEVSEVIRRPHLAKLFEDESRITYFLTELEEYGERVVPRTPYPAFSDPNDRYLLAMLRDGDADLLVTGDKALLKMEQFEGKSILSAAAFVEGLGQ